MDESMDALSTRELGGFLITNRAVIDAAEAKWLQHLAEFDRRCGFTADGHRDSVSWLIHKCGLARTTAKERLRIARELRHRPVLAEALAAGKVSYTKIKTLTRITGMGDDNDKVFVCLAADGTHADVQRLYRHWQLLRDQDTPPPENRWERCGIQTVARNSGVAVTETRMCEEDEQRFMRILDLGVEVLCPRLPVGEAPMGAIPGEDREAPMGANPLGQPTWTPRRVDA